MAAPLSSSSSSSRNWLYDVFPSFRGEDVRVAFLSHFLKELDRKLITAFKDSEIEKSGSLDPELRKAIKDSRIAVVIFSRNYASSSWCLNELLEIVNCKEEFGQIVIPVFYGLDPSNVRKQTGDFGKVFEETCLKNTEEVKIRWKEALTNVANLLGYHHSVTWGNEATMIEAIANDVLSKLLLTPSKDFEDFVGIKDHISKMIKLLDLKSEEVKMIGIWGSSGIGKTTIARVLFNRLSQYFQGSIYLDRFFIADSMEVYSKHNPYDYNMMLHLQKKFLCKLLVKHNIEFDHLGAVKEKLKKIKVLIFIDDLDDRVVLEALVGGSEWFGPRSRIIAVTKDKQVLRGHKIECVYEVGLPSAEVALQMFCRYAFSQNSPPDGFMELASEVAARTGRLPLGLNLIGSSMRGKNKEYWVNKLPDFRNGLDGNIQNALRVSYDGLESEKHKALFRHIACFFNGDKVDNIELILADSKFNVKIGLEILIDRSLIQVTDTKSVEMHSLIKKMGIEIVRAQSDDPGEWEFLTDSKNVCDVLKDGPGTKKTIGISLDIDEIDRLQIHKKAFKGMINLRFLNIYTKKLHVKEEFKWHTREGFNYLPPKLRLLRWDGYPMRHLPSSFCPENLVKLEMQGSKLEKLWEGTQSLPGLKNMDLRRSSNLKEIPDLSMATALETLNLKSCSSLVELPSFIQNLNKLKELDMSLCENLEILPTGVDLQSLERLSFAECPRLKSFPYISRNISVLELSKAAIEEFLLNLPLKNLVELSMWSIKSEKLRGRDQPLKPLMDMLSPSLTSLSLADIPALVELPSSFQNLSNLEELRIENCINLETLPNGINLESLDHLELSRCPQLRSFPDISTNISYLYLDKTGIEEVPWWIENFNNLSLIRMQECKSLKRVSLNISKLKYLATVDFSDCEALTEVSLYDSPSAVVALSTDNIRNIQLSFRNCFNLRREALVEIQTVLQELVLPAGKEVLSYFTHQTSGNPSFLTIPLLPSFLSEPFFRFRVCAVMSEGDSHVYLRVKCQFKGRSGNIIFESFGQQHVFFATQKGSDLCIFDCRFPLNKDNDHVDIHLHVGRNAHQADYTIKLKRWGVRLFNDYSSAENGLGNPNTLLPHVCEADEDNMVNDECHETEQGEECGDSMVEIEERRKRMRVSMKLIRFIIHITARRSWRNEILKVLERSLKAGSKD